MYRCNLTTCQLFWTILSAENSFGTCKDFHQDSQKSGALKWTPLFTRDARREKHVCVPSLRFAVGTGDGVILVYDLRTATKWRVFEARWDVQLAELLNAPVWWCFMTLHQCRLSGSQWHGGWVGLHTRCCSSSLAGSSEVGTFPAHVSRLSATYMTLQVYMTCISVLILMLFRRSKSKSWYIMVIHLEFWSDCVDCGGLWQCHLYWQQWLDQGTVAWTTPCGYGKQELEASGAEVGG